jgi:uncharacterized membrane protein
MEMNRVESFSDGVIAVIITIMVLELKVPADSSLASLEKVLPQVLAYLYSFATVAVMWSNHHHLLKGARRPDSRLIWANNNLLFWMSLVPFVTAYMAAYPLEALPVALYGIVLSMMGFGFNYLRHAILAQRHTSLKGISAFQKRMRWKNTVSAIAYLSGAGLAFFNVWICFAIYIGIPAMYFLPDPSLVEHAGTDPD